MKPYIPKAGDIVWIDFQPTRGHEQKGERPALVLSPKEYNTKVGLMLVCPVTSTVKGYPFEVVLTGTKKVRGVVLADQVRSVDWRLRHTRYIESVSFDVLVTTTMKLTALIKRVA